jgi:hypothetical protein
VPDAAPDLRTFLAANQGATFRPDRAVSVVEEITALQHALYEQGAQPVVMIDRPVHADGTESEMPQRHSGSRITG